MSKPDLYARQHLVPKKNTDMKLKQENHKFENHLIQKPNLFSNVYVAIQKELYPKQYQVEFKKPNAYPLSLFKQEKDPCRKLQNGLCLFLLLETSLFLSLLTLYDYLSSLYSSPLPVRSTFVVN